MGRFLVRRLLQAVFVILCVAVVIFFIMRLIPGDPARTIAPRASEEVLAALREQLGLNKPILVQFIAFLSRAVRGDFGNSYYDNVSALTLITRSLPLTFLLTGITIVIASVSGVTLGIIAAMRRDTWVDRLVLGVQMLFQSAPNFWVALVLLLLVAVKAKLLPAIGFSGPQSAILPAIALSLGLIAMISRTVRMTLVDLLELDMVKALRARGISPAAIVWRHALKNALLPVLTLIGAQVGYLLGGAVVAESIFNYPGLGLLTLNAVLRRDLPLIQAIVVVSSGILVAVNLAIDISYGMIDPRARQQE